MKNKIFLTIFSVFVFSVSAFCEYKAGGIITSGDVDSKISVATSPLANASQVAEDTTTLRNEVNVLHGSSATLTEEVDGLQLFTSSMTDGSAIVAFTSMTVYRTITSSTGFVGGQSTFTFVHDTGGAYFGGNVGIGTINPIQVLDVLGNIAISKSGTSSIYASASNLNLGATSNDKLQLVTNNKIRITVLGNGNVGISTKVPQAKFHVATTTGDTCVLVKVSTDGTDVLEVTASSMSLNIPLYDSGNLLTATSSYGCGHHIRVTSSLVVSTSWEPVTSTSAIGHAHNMTTNTTTMELTIQKEGIYWISASISFSGTANEIFEWAIFINDVVKNQFYVTRTLSAGGTTDFGDSGAFGLIPLSIGDVIQVKVMSPSGGTAFIPRNFSLTAEWIK